MSRVWFVTGAGSGIGAGTAKAALQAGDRVVATGRTSTKCAMPTLIWRRTSLRPPWSSLRRSSRRSRSWRQDRASRGPASAHKDAADDQPSEDAAPRACGRDRAWRCRDQLVSHNRSNIQGRLLRPFFDENEALVADDIAEAVAFKVTRPRHAAVNNLWIGPPDQI